MPPETGANHNDVEEEGDAGRSHVLHISVKLVVEERSVGMTSVEEAERCAQPEQKIQSSTYILNMTLASP